MNTNLPRRDRTSLHTYSKLKIQTRTKQDQAIETKPTTNRNLTICCQDQLHSPRNRGDDSSLSYEPRENSPQASNTQPTHAANNPNGITHGIGNREIEERWREAGLTERRRPDLPRRRERERRRRRALPPAKGRAAHLPLVEPSASAAEREREREGDAVALGSEGREEEEEKSQREEDEERGSGGRGRGWWARWAGGFSMWAPGLVKFRVVSVGEKSLIYLPSL